MTHGSQSVHPVLELLLARGRENSQPGARRDGARLGLAIEGGGMRGVVSAGMARALELLGLRDAFDVVFGSSAGAMNGAFFVAGQAAYGTPIYYEDINNSKFLSVRRAVTRRPMMSLNYLLEDVMTRRKVLDWRAILESSVPLEIVASSVDTLRSHVFREFGDRQQLFTALRASSSVPWVAGPPLEVNGQHYFDAVIFEPIPFRSALENHCTHVLTLLSRPEGQAKGLSSWLDRTIARRLSPSSPKLSELYLRQAQAYNEDVEHLRDTTSNPQGPPYVCAVSLPRATKSVRALATRSSRLLAAAAAGEQAVLAALESEWSPENNGSRPPIGPIVVSDRAGT